MVRGTCRWLVNRIHSCEIDYLECLKSDPNCLACHSTDLSRNNSNQSKHAELDRTAKQRASLFGKHNKINKKNES